MQQYEFVAKIERLLNKNNISRKITVYKGKMNTSISNIPSSFINVMSEILTILSKSFNLICVEKNKGILIVGLKPCVSMIEKNSEQHFCCSLEYEVHPLNKLHQIDKRTHSKSVIINFTTGEIMNENMYVNQLFKDYLKNALVYGSIESQKLALCWKEANWNSDQVYKCPEQDQDDFYMLNTDHKEKTSAAIPFFNLPELAAYRHARNLEISYSPLDEYIPQNDEHNYNISNY